MNCARGLATLHRLWHDVMDPEKVCLQSGAIHIPDTDPDVTIVVLFAVVESKDAAKIQNAAHETIEEAMTEAYGPSESGYTVQ